ncbi:MAG: hypothetical protein LCH46_13700 [Proteobacteria bacterium]|nr:hypothetical protein [Pseudomonadota bacterium]
MTILQDRLQVLIGLPLSVARNAAAMKVLHFGTVRPHRSGRGTAGTVGDYAFHIQCPWRIVSDSAIITGDADRCVGPSGGFEINDEDWKSGNLQLVRLTALMGGFDEATKSLVNITDRLVVQAVSSDIYGGVDVLLSGGFNLQIFPDASTGENWRFIQVDGYHLVFEGGCLTVEE